ncbi:uncharacterized protein PV09_02150 [Verruconis gallopava]|uniref:Uncharacterized protein n=1 Tax=Verruconis gallopava TaxID=253628 RepID=A0A0D2AL95_9PEZI|nr:uncharacterized protein PV09_02150 [Verruconis gallopava]KIW07300.1 hypothetical protein PV09_02150 [Verruconis gallopava]
MDIHRARFIPYPSSAINALAFSAINDGELAKGGLKNLRLAVGRANGDIEIWNPLRGAWVQETVFHGGKGRTIEGLLWIQEPNEFDTEGRITSTGQLRLFSIGYSSAVTEWDLGTGLPLRHSTGNLNEIWCFAAQPRLHVTESRKAANEGKPRGQDIVVGCSDGSIALLSTADNDLHFQKYISRPHGKDVRPLSISFRDRYTIAVGFNNSTFRIYDIRNSKVIRTVSLGAGSKGGPKDLHVWAIRWLPSGEIACADSAGDLRFFDSKLFTQYQRINAHRGDIFSIAISHDGSSLFTAGADRRTSIFRRGRSGRQWNKQTHKFYHDHDVKALAVYDGNKTQQMSFLASGGLDTNLAIVPIQHYGEEYHRGISGLPQLPPVTSSEATRLVACWHGQEVDIWKIQSQDGDTGNGGAPRRLVHMTIKGEEAIANASLSKDGELIAISTAAVTQLFRISRIEDGPKEKLQIVKLTTEAPLDAGRIVQISGDQKWLSIVTHNNDVLVFRLSRQENGVQLSKQPFRLERIKRGSDTSSLGSYRRRISRLQFSPDSKVLVVADLAGFIDCWQLEGIEDTSAPDVEMIDVGDDTSDNSSSDEDDDNDQTEMKSFGQHWTRMVASKALPQLDSAALFLTFRPGRRTKKAEANGTPRKEINGIKTKHAPKQAVVERDDDALVEQTNDKYELFVLTAKHQLYEFDLATGQLTSWSRQNTTDCLPDTFQKIKDRAMGCYWHTTLQAQRLYVYGSNWLFMLDVMQDFVPETKDEEPESENGGLIARPQKRNRQGKSGAGDKIRDEDYVGFKPGVESIQDGEPVKKKRKPADQTQPLNGQQTDREDDEDVDADEEPASKNLRGKRSRGQEADGEGELGDGPRKTWHSFAYRPILAVIPLQETASYIETVVVERPMWELDLPPRLLGPHDKAR